ncbi:MAG: DUF378 domain-containing protein [bacterium]|nr:DUF378 domain-containing protein [bacterium]
MKGLHIVSWILLVIGGLNWGLVGIADYNVVALFGSTLETIIYVLVGLSAIVQLFTYKKCCGNGSSSQAM